MSVEMSVLGYNPAEIPDVTCGRVAMPEFISRKNISIDPFDTPLDELLCWMFDFYYISEKIRILLKSDTIKRVQNQHLDILVVEYTMYVKTLLLFLHKNKL